ncbi:hypothetical protein ACT17_32920 [Mycolicibacterium conceptionense]|jgi:hypothetical protein|uniref:Uncharacterized protein n=3 Tax=Mycolicibacterium TaxID=1866885 RepID=A0A132PEE3_9MYCO|nr:MULTISPECIES: hypothetical protein [Mycolicibacterium]KLI04829.1 hypothetical protein AA982_28070 [Mycolicibacterium senegalense]KLO47487.1 hypothetical protein ABW05_32570 [Mycolicibacterium senegalense]KMV13908.1 hypothetical protein ACT17_32920 [Mycolicibacterium conceptionense]KWX20695.1 hypothetical protein AFM11_29180 [Mycolicibacterium wolinskyi]
MTTQQRNTDIDDERPTRLNAEAADKFIEHLSMHDREVQRHRLISTGAWAMPAATHWHLRFMAWTTKESPS